MNDTSKKVCRTCLNKNIKMVWIGADHIVCENVMSVSQLIMACAPIKINVGDELPQYVCRSCIYSAERSYNFRIKCQKTDSIFQKRVSKNNMDEVFSCPKCKVEHESLKDFIDHITSHDENDLHYHHCSQCSNSFYSEASLKKHLKVHANLLTKKVNSTNDAEIESTEETAPIKEIKQAEPYDCKDESDVPVNNYEKQNFVCCYCNEQFDNNSELQLHKNKHLIKMENDNSENSDFKCYQCNLNFEDELSHDEHLKTHDDMDTTEESYNCKYCSKAFKDIDSYSDHLIEHKKDKTIEIIEGDKDSYECNICSLNFLSKEKLMLHIKIHVKHQCDMCNLNFDSAENLTKHASEHNEKSSDNMDDDIKDIDYANSDDNDYIIEDFESKKCGSDSKMYYSCKLCSSQFHNFREIKYHLATHEIKNKELFKNLCYKCEECASEFTTIYEFFKHKISESNEFVSNMFTNGKIKRKRIYGCSKCSKKFPSPSSLRTHERTHRNKWPKACTYCSEVVNSLHQLMQHCNLKHEDKKEFTCETCGKKFFALKNLKIHKKTHSEKTHMCDICGHSFQAYNNLLSHRRLHTGDKPYKCMHCSKAFAQHASLRSHLLNHNDERNYQCPICEKRFRRSGALHTHKKTHTGVKDYTCEICEKKFAASSTRKKHMLTHTGERNFVCDICNKAFGRKSNLTVHRKIHTGERPNVCEICGKGFLQAHVLRSHLNTHRKLLQQSAPQSTSSS